MSAKKGLNLSNGFLASNPMAKYSDYAWTEAASNNNTLGASTSSFLTTSDYSLMSRFALNSSLTLHSNADSDATNSSTSSISATNNSSSSLSISPAVEREARTLSKAPLTSPVSNHQTASNHLLQLQKEIKEEEEEIFADINSLINRRSYLFSSVDDGDEDDGINLDGEDNHTSFKPNPDPTNTNTQPHSFVGPLTNKTLFTSTNTSATTTATITSPSSTAAGNDPHNYLSLKAESSSTNPYQSIIESYIRCSSRKGQDHDDLPSRVEQKASDTVSGYIQHQDELRWQGDDSDQMLQEATQKEMGDESPRLEQEPHHECDPDYASEYPYTANSETQSELRDHQAFKAAMQQAASNLPKPCVFFLEGNCRRSDCKYSHDLSNITCKYWIEGFCFKGDMCPFLHSFATMSNSKSDGLSDDDGLESSKKKELNPTFVIESEADFPSLPLDTPAPGLDDSGKNSIDVDTITNTIKNQILSSNPAVVFKTIKKKRKRG